MKNTFMTLEEASKIIAEIAQPTIGVVSQIHFEDIAANGQENIFLAFDNELGSFQLLTEAEDIVFHVLKHG